jgi:spore coat protein U-like protein
MNKITRLILALFILGGAYSANALSLSSSSTYKRTDYSSQNGTTIEWSFTVSHSGAAVSWFIGVSGGHSGNSSSRTLFSWSVPDKLNYYIYDNETEKNILKDASDNPSSSEVISGSFSASGSTQYQNITITVVVPSGLFSSSGEFGDTVKVQLYEGTPSSYKVIWQSINVNHVFVVPEIMEISIVDTNNPFDPSSTSETFAFGVLSTGERRTADIIVRSTKNYSVRLNSSNQGIMKRVDMWDPSSTIPYNCFVDGNAVNLSGYSSVEVASGSTTPANGTRHSVEIEIGDFWGIEAGDFEDIITIELTGQW